MSDLTATAGAVRELTERIKALSDTGPGGPSLAEQEVGRLAGMLGELEERITAKLADLEGLRGRLDATERRIDEKTAALEAKIAENEAADAEREARLRGLIDENVGVLNALEPFMVETERTLQAHKAALETRSAGASPIDATLFTRQEERFNGRIAELEEKLAAQGRRATAVGEPGLTASLAATQAAVIRDRQSLEVFPKDAVEVLTGDEAAAYLSAAELLTPKLVRLREAGAIQMVFLQEDVERFRAAAPKFRIDHLIAEGEDDGGYGYARLHTTEIGALGQAAVGAQLDELYDGLSRRAEP